MFVFVQPGEEKGDEMKVSWRGCCLLSPVVRGEQIKPCCVVRSEVKKKAPSGFVCDGARSPGRIINRIHRCCLFLRFPREITEKLSYRSAVNIHSFILVYRANKVSAVCCPASTINSPSGPDDDNSFSSVRPSAKHLHFG